MTSGFTNWTDVGFFPLQDHEDGVPFGLRQQLAGGRIVSFKDPSMSSSSEDNVHVVGVESEMGTLGDIHPWFFWQTRDRETRPTGAWAQAFASITSEGGTGGGRYGRVPTGILPIRTDDVSVDGRLKTKTPGWPECFPTIPQGVMMVTMAGMDETSQQELMLHADPRLISVNTEGPATAGTLVCDLQEEGEVCMDGSSTPGVGGRAARLQSMVRVVPFESPALGAGEGNGLAWNLALSGEDNLAGYGMCFAKLEGGGGGGGGRTTGGRIRKGPSGKGYQENSMGGGGGGGGDYHERHGDTPGDFGNFTPKAKNNHGLMFMAQVGANGPFTAGTGGDKHNVGVDGDGHPMNSGHISANAYFYGDSVKDGPMLFEPQDYPEIPSLNLHSRVHLAFDSSLPHKFLDGLRPGHWRWYSESTVVIPKKGPPTGGGPTTPGGPFGPGGPTPIPGGPTGRPGGSITPGGKPGPKTGVPRSGNNPGGPYSWQLPISRTPRGPTTRGGFQGSQKGAGSGAGTPGSGQHQGTPVTVTGPKTGKGGNWPYKDRFGGDISPYSPGGWMEGETGRGLRPPKGSLARMAWDRAGAAGRRPTKKGDESFRRGHKKRNAEELSRGRAAGMGKGKSPYRYGRREDGTYGWWKKGGVTPDNPFPKTKSHLPHKDQGWPDWADGGLLIPSHNFDPLGGAVPGDGGFYGWNGPNWPLMSFPGGPVEKKKTELGDNPGGSPGLIWDPPLQPGWCVNSQEYAQTSSSVGQTTADDISLFQVFHPMMEGFAAMSFRPQNWTNGQPSTIHNPDLDNAKARCDEAERPQTLAMNAWGGTNPTTGQYEYVQPPAESRARGGTAHGGVFFHPPHLEMEDFFGLGSNTNVRSVKTVSYLAMGPGTGFALGTPELNGGLKPRSVVISQPLVDTDDDFTINQIDASSAQKSLFYGRLSQSSGEIVSRAAVNLNAAGNTNEGGQAFVIPRGTTAERQSTIALVGGEMRMNTNVTSSVDTPEFYDRQTASWKQLTTQGVITATPDNDKLDKDGSSAMTGGLTINSSDGLTIVGAAPQIKISDSSTDEATKKGFITLAHDDNAEEPFGLIYARSQDLVAKLSLGGGDSSVNAASAVSIYVAANGDTVTGTEIIRVKTSGMRIGGSGSPTASCILDLGSVTGQTFLPPKGTTSQRDAISQETGSIYYNVTTNKLQCHNGSGWQDCF